MFYRWLWRIVGFGAALFIVWPFLSWQLKAEKTMDIVVIDKTVPVKDYREHLGLFWILENAKLSKPGGGFYRADADYYGNHPETGAAQRDLSLTRNPDLIYVTDTYGVYRADLEKGKPTGERSNLLYGGLTSYEWDQITQAKSGDTKLILEFNSIASPTSEKVRGMVENTMGFKWTGWIGRYFPDLQNDEVPVWLKTNYEKMTGEPWKLKGPAIAFVDESDRIVLLQANDFKGEVRFSLTPEGRRQYPHASDSEYGYWFDIMIPGDRLDVDAVYDLGLTDQGKKQLRENGIPSTFPAVLRDAERNYYYFSGDYADIGVKYLAKLEAPKMFLRILSMVRKDERFYWQSYVPMMKQILKEVEMNHQTQENGLQPG